jgi:hypothetical protein
MTTTPQLHVGHATHASGLSIFPVWTDLTPPTDPIPTALPVEATVGELPTGSEVDKLQRINPTDTVFLLPGGTLFDGGWQHRVLTNTVLVEGAARMSLDVRCVEQGRWNGDTTQRVAARRAPLAVRGARRGIHLGADPAPRQRADQGDIWNRVAHYETRLGGSASNSMVEVAARVSAQLPGVLDRVPVLPGQQGVIIGIGGWPALVEVFDHPTTLADQWTSIIGGVLADAVMAQDPQPSCP